MQRNHQEQGEEDYMNPAQHKSNNEVQIFLENFPKLSVVNLYLLFDKISPSAAALITIDANEDRVHIPSLKVGTSFAGLTFESIFNMGPQTVRDNIVHFRLVTKPTNSLAGTGRAEIISRNLQNETFDQGIRNLLKNSLNEVALLEHNPYAIHCRRCHFLLSTMTGKTTLADEGVKFQRIRPLPGANWEETANDLWFCHPPHPRQNCTHMRTEPTVTSRGNQMNNTDSLSRNFSNVQIVENPTTPDESTATSNAFRAIRAPEKECCYYGPCYWALNPCIVPQILFHHSHENNPQDYDKSILNIKATCPSCDTEIGIFRTRNCILLWDFGVKWVHLPSMKSLVLAQEPATKIEICSGTPQNVVEEEAAENFKKVIFAALYEWSFDLTCKLFVKAVDSSTSLFLWNIDRNLTVYHGKLLNNSNTNVIRPQKVAKFMFCPLISGELVVDNPCDVNVFKSGGSDHQIFVPNTVLNSGCKVLEKTSSLFLTSPGSLQCGFLTYNKS